MRSLRLALAGCAALALAGCAGLAPVAPPAGELLPTGQRITPLAAAGARFEPLNPDLAARPDYLAGQAVELALSPDERTLLVLTSGYNRVRDASGRFIPGLSNEYVFVFDVTGPQPVKRQVLPIANSFTGLAWRPDGGGFYVADGRIALGHERGLGIDTRPMAAGIAVSPDAGRLLVANYENDSVSLVDPAARRVLAERDLRPGGGKPGGAYPISAVWVSQTRAFVASQRDRELVRLRIEGDQISVDKRVPIRGQPTKLITNRDRTILFVAADNSDSVIVLEADGDLLAEIPTAAPAALLANAAGLKGANPNNLALSPDQHSLFVSNGGMNAVAIVQLGRDVLRDADDQPRENRPVEQDNEESAGLPAASRVIGLIPTGWYPNAVAIGRGGRTLHVVNGKSNAGPNPQACRNSLSTARAATDRCQAANQYVWQLSKAGFLTLPMPDATELAHLTLQVAANDNFALERTNVGARMEFLRRAIRHVVYIVKENRTYDQILGDLEIGNGDPSLALLPRRISPNHHALARGFVTLDNFFASGETSNTGWNWTTAARSNDFTEKEAPVNYAGRGLGYDQEGTNRNINVALPDLAARRAANPATPADPDLLPGTADVAALDPPAQSGGEAGTGYLWDAALRAGLTIRNYGFYGDLGRYFQRGNTIPPIRDPFAEKRIVFFPSKPSLLAASDPYYRGFDMAFPDFWRVREWEREFAGQEAAGSMPNLTLIRLPHDHFGAFGQAIDGVNTPETQMADNDYALGRIVERIAASRFAGDTLIFVVEDDAQDGADHVDAHRSLALVIGPYVRQGALVSTRYSTVNLLRTIEEVLGLPPLGLNDGLALPMAELFDPGHTGWRYRAVVPEPLRRTALPLPPPARISALSPCPAGPDATWWQDATRGQFFGEEDRLDSQAFNAALWRGFMGEAPQPGRSGRDLGRDRAALLAGWRAGAPCR